MALSDYTSFADVRAALGVGSKEITDEVLGLALYEDSLMVQLEEIGDTFVDDLQVLMAIAEVDQTRTQKTLLRLSRLFTTYSVAHQLTSTLPLFSPQEVTDGKAVFHRYGDSPYTKTIAHVTALYEQYSSKLNDAYASFTSTSATIRVKPVLMAISSPSTDVVTGS